MDGFTPHLVLLCENGHIMSRFVDRMTVENGFMMGALASARYDEAYERTVA